MTNGIGHKNKKHEGSTKKHTNRKQATKKQGASQSKSGKRTGVRVLP